MSMLESLSPPAKAIRDKLERFVIEECQPAELEYEEHMKTRLGADRWTFDAIPPCMERLKTRAKQLGLWNLFIPPHLIPHLPERSLGPEFPLTFREYGVLCESMGKSFLAPEACNCNAPDTGNMEVLLHHGTDEQKKKYLVPLLKGEIRSTFLMTEPRVASSDATNMETSLKRMERDGEVSYVLNGRKWWSTGAMDPRCKVALVLAKMDHSESSVKSDGSKKSSQTVALVDMSDPGVTMVRALQVFGYDDAPHGHAEVDLKNIHCTPSSLIIGEGKGFMVAQARLGPGRIHHCMRAIGMAQRCYDLMLERTLTRKTFGKMLAEHGGCQEMIADSASDLDAARLLTLACADQMDRFGAIKARDKISSIKVSVPELTSRVADRAVQIFGGAGVCEDFPLARILAGLRTLRIADGPDAVHKRTVALLEIKRAKHQLGEKSRMSRL
jgi:acyl-CoA dehydrogenase